MVEVAPGTGAVASTCAHTAAAAANARGPSANSTVTASASRTVAAVTLAMAASAILVLGAAAQVPLGTPIPAPPLGQLSGEETVGESFRAHQLAFSRVVSARDATDLRLRDRFDRNALRYPASEIFLRVFKHERVLQLWARSRPGDVFTLVHEYPVCALPGQLGPKRRMGDLQVPEGVYYIDHFNPESAYHLSLRINYPNLADRMRRQALALGGDIFIHGGCETVGCVPIENDNMEEVYWLAVQAMDAGQKVIPVHIFPARLDASRLQWLEDTFQPEADLLQFWHDLAPAYAFFEETRRVPWVTVGEDGRYAVPETPRVAADAVAPDATRPAQAGGDGDVR